MHMMESLSVSAMSKPIYHMPAEWEKQEAIWLAWPHEREDWPGKFQPIPWVYCEIIRNIAKTQKVRLLVQNQNKHDKAIKKLEAAHCNLDNIEFFHVPTNRVWVRDSGPIFAYDEQGEQVLLDWQFNAWAKYGDWQLDNQVPEHVEEHHPGERIAPTYQGKPVVLEGGAIDVNGAGLLLATKECLLDQQVQTRNAGFTEADYAAIFEQHLGAQEIIWLEQGIVGDDTHGHVDDITRFVDTHKVLTAVETDKSDDNFEILKQNLKTLKGYQTKAGNSLDVIELPMPKALYFDGTRLPASYANFLICNDVVLVPTFNDPNDRIALAIIADCFPTREVIGIHSVDLIWGFGAIHCLSQQQPKLRL